MAGSLPSPDDALRPILPLSNLPGSFPKEGLLAGERIVFESRPRLVRYHWALFWIPMIPIGLLAFAILEEWLTAPLATFLAGLPAVLGFTLLIALLPAYATVSAYRTGYALTDQRVLVRSGSDIEGVPWERVLGIAIAGRSSEIVFQLSQVPGTPRRKSSGEKEFLLRWPAVRGAPSVANFATQASKLFVFRSQQRRLVAQATETQLQDKLLCQYCGGLTPIRELNPNNPRCPRCAAPFVILPRGM